MRSLAPHTRRVHQVRLSAPTQGLIWRGQNLLEDALSTVSLPTADTSQLLFIRHFNAGTIDGSQSSTSLSVSLAARLQQLSAIAVLGTHSAAAQAPAVIFPDDLSAYAHFAYQLAIGHAIGKSPSHSLNAWFWPCLLPQWQSTQSAHETALHLLAQLATHELAPIATATVLRQLQQQQALAYFLTLIQSQDGSALLAQQGWYISPAATRPESEFTDYSLQSIFWSDQPQHWTAKDPRTLWLTAMGLIAQRPALATDSDLIAIAWQQLHSPFTSNATAHHEPILSDRDICDSSSLFSNSKNSDPQNISPALTSQDHLRQKSYTQPTLSQASLSISAADSEAAPAVAKDPSVSSQSTSSDPRRTQSADDSISLDLVHTSDHRQLTPFSGLNTNYAGLIYLLNLLTYLHFPDYLPRYNNPAFPHLLLLYTALRLGAPTTDPILTVFANDGLFPPRDFLSTEDTKSALNSLIAHHIPKADQDNSSPVIFLSAWYSALRHWLRRYTPFTLTDLICRPGVLALTPTHLDLTFALTQVDIHIRRAGLDLNLGWLPWFGRVVQFHYRDPSENSHQDPFQRGSTL